MSIGKKIASARKAAGLTQAELARAVGMSQTAIADLENGRTRRAIKLHEIAQALARPISDFLDPDTKLSSSDTSTIATSKITVLNLSVCGEVAAGRWMEADSWDAEKYDPVPVVPAGFPGLAQSAWAVVGNSMDLAGINHGAFIVTVPYWEVRTELEHGDICLIERRQGQLVERTCKEIHLDTGKLKLVPRSSDERWKTVVIDPAAWTDQDGHEVEVIGLVIGTFMRLARR